MACSIAKACVNVWSGRHRLNMDFYFSQECIKLFDRLLKYKG